MSSLGRLASVFAGLGLCLAAAACDDAGPSAGDLGADERDLSSSDVAAPSDLADPGDLSDVPDMARDPNGVTTLRVHYPVGARALTVRGDQAPLGWQSGIAMTSLGGDAYAYKLTLPPGVAQVEWKPLVDGTWSRGPNYVAERGETVDVYPHFFDQTGTVSKLFAAFHSNALNVERPVWLYLPASYAENTAARYPVLYMFDGQNLFDPAGPFGGWHVNDALDDAAEDGSIREIIVVAPENGYGNRTYEYTPTYDPTDGPSGGGDKTLQLFVDELKPVVDTMLRTRPGRATTGIMGSSLGGLMATYAGVKRASTFGLVGAMSPSTWWDNLYIVDQVKAMSSPRPDRVYLDVGTVDDGQEDTDLLAAAFQMIGYQAGNNLRYVVTPGAQHSENWWAARVPGALQFLFGKR